MGVLKEQNLGILVDAINRNVNTKINAIKGSNNATDVNMQDGTTVEVAVNKNKSDITDINTYLNKSENTKYQTVNGVKEFESKDGYVDDIVIEGKTIDNMWGLNGFSFSGDNVVNFTEGKIKFTSKANRYSNFFDRNLNMLKPSTDYTTIAFVYRNEFTDGTICINNPSGLSEGAFETIIKIPPNQTGTFVNKIRTKESFEDLSNNVGLRSFFDNVSSEVGKNVELQILVLEGDYTQNPPSYFEGLASVGQGDKIEILTRNENLFNFDKRWFIESSISYSILGTNSIEVIKKDGRTYDYVGYEFKLTPHARYEVGAIISNNLNTRCGIGIKNSSNSVVASDITNERPKGEFVVPSDGIIRLNFYPTLNTTDNATMVAENIFIRKVEHKDNPYTPSKSDKKQILTTLRSLPNGVKDEIYKVGNKYYKIQRCGEITLNGSNAWSSDSSKWNETTVKPFVAGAIPNAKVNGNNLNIFCNNFKPSVIHSETITIEGIYYSKSLNIHVRILKSRLSTVDLAGIKAYLNANPITIVYELAEPIVTELANLNLRTFSPQTTMLINSGVVQGDISFEVTNTLGSSIDAMADKIGSLEDMLGGQLEIGTERINSLLRKING